MTPFSIRVVEYYCAGQRQKKILAVYLLRPEISENSFDGALSQVLSCGIQFDAIHFVGFEDCLNQARLWLNGGTSVLGRLELVVVDLQKNTRLISFDEKTGKHTAICIDGTNAPDWQSIINAVKKYTLQELFVVNNGHMVAPQGFHYVKPSDKHVNTFLRAANVLENSSAAQIIAFWIMPHIWEKGIEHIVVDTSGISDIALTVAYEAVFRGGLTKLPIVYSHQSYGGLEQFKINRPEATLLLISATTSGGLKDELINKGANGEKIVTLFYLGLDHQKAGHVLCDLTRYAPDEKYGLDIIENFIATECPYCKKQSYPVSLGGDQFTFEPPKVEEIHVALSDLPSIQQSIFNKLAGIDFFKVYRNLNGRSLEIYFDVKTLFSKPRIDYRPTLDLLDHLSQRWQGMVLRGAPVNLKRIIYATYPFSEELAESANGVVLEYEKGLVDSLLSSRELRSLSSLPSPGSAALVVVSCIDDSHELMAINRDLRAHHPHGNTSYIAPIFRADSGRERIRIKSNLTFGENGANTFSLHSMVDIDLPEENKNHSWNSELKVLHEIVDWADLEGLGIPEEISNRIIFLEERAPTTGISDQLFWPDCKGIPLKVRSDFTLLSTEGGTRSLSQADIFAVVSAVIHNLRQGVPSKPKLAYKQYERSVLSPDNFERFNDGIIQSAILRAARGYELAYANCDEQVSERMKNFIISHIENVSNGEGEALLEFLLAIASGRLTLYQQHIKELAQAIQGQSSLAPHYQIFANYLISNP